MFQNGQVGEEMADSEMRKWKTKRLSELIVVKGFGCQSQASFIHKAILSQVFIRVTLHLDFKESWHVVEMGDN